MNMVKIFMSEKFHLRARWTFSNLKILVQDSIDLKAKVVSAGLMGDSGAWVDGSRLAKTYDFRLD